MPKFRSIALLIGVALSLAGANAALAQDREMPVEPGVYALFYTDHGQFACRLFEHEAPQNVRNFIDLACGYKAWTDPRNGEVRRAPYYDELPVYNVSRNAMIVSGDPLSNGQGSPGYFVNDEISPNLDFSQPGRLAMANLRGFTNRNAGTWFITLTPAPQFDGQYTIIGEVVLGMDVVRDISRVEADANGTPQEEPIVNRIDIIRVLRNGEVVLFERSTYRPYADIASMDPLHAATAAPTWASAGNASTRQLPELPPIYGPLPED